MAKAIEHYESQGQVIGKTTSSIRMLKTSNLMVHFIIVLRNRLNCPIHIGWEQWTAYFKEAIRLNSTVSLYKIITYNSKQRIFQHSVIFLLKILAIRTM